MLRHSLLLLLAFPIGLLHVSAQDKEAKSKPAPVKVEKGPLTSVVTLRGILQGENSKEITVRLKAASGPMLVQQAIEHGAKVKKGDVLVVFDAEKLENALRDAKQDRELTELAIRQAEVEFPILEKQAPLDLLAAERAFQESTDDLNHFLSVDRGMDQQSAEFSLKQATHRLDSAKDELKQLQKMYKDKDLTEETEQQILRRYQFSVLMDEFFLKQTQLRTEHTLKVTIPRREKTAKDTVVRSEIALTRAREASPLALKQKQLGLAKLRYDAAKAKVKLEELEHDLALMTVVSPIEGVTYYGRYLRGKWMVPEGPQETLIRGGNITPGSVFLTIVPTGKLVLRAEAEERELPGLTAGLGGKLTPTAFPEQKIAVKIRRTAAAPLQGRFEVLVDLEDKNANLVPGMTGSIRFVTSKKTDALTVPASAVFEDTDEDRHFVYRLNGEKRTVRVGRIVGDRREILEGLAEGDEISATKP